MSLVLQISDPHFGMEQAPVVEALVRLVCDQAPTLIVLWGDLVLGPLLAEVRRSRLAENDPERTFAPPGASRPCYCRLPLGLPARGQLVVGAHGEVLRKVRESARCRQQPTG
jgi:3',5'-cyclic AMP phosphodiesterase CpdA